MILTDRADWAERMRRFRNHGIDTDHHQRAQQNRWQYQMADLGYNYRLTDFQSALGLSQLAKLPGWIKSRCLLAEQYQENLQSLPQVKLITQYPDRLSAWHLLVVRVPGRMRDKLFDSLRNSSIGVNVHYGLVYRHPYYRQHFSQFEGSCPIAEQNAERILSLPIYPSLGNDMVSRVCREIRAFFEKTDEDEG